MQKIKLPFSSIFSLLVMVLGIIASVGLLAAATPGIIGLSLLYAVFLLILFKTLISIFLILIRSHALQMHGNATIALCLKTGNDQSGTVLFRKKGPEKNSIFHLTMKPSMNSKINRSLSQVCK